MLRVGGYVDADSLPGGVPPFRSPGILREPTACGGSCPCLAW